MYATPASGGGPSANELEDYLLGKKRVDQILKGDESKQVRLYNLGAAIKLTQELLGWSFAQKLYRSAECQYHSGYRCQDPRRPDVCN